MLEVDREQVLAYRIAAHGLHREETDATAAAVFDLGLQDSVRDTALLGLAARVDGEIRPAVWDDPRFVLAWTHRGAPHFHRRVELDAIRAALVPLDEKDAMARILWQRKQVEDAGMSAMDALFTAANAIRKVVTGVQTKGTASGAVTKLIPDGLSYACRGCGVVHIYEQLMRVASIHAGVRLEPGAKPATLAPLEKRGAVKSSPDVKAATRVIEGYLRINGPAAPGDAATYVGTTRTGVDAMWPGNLVEVRVDGKKAFLPEDRMSLLENPPEPDVVRLLPPLDPFVQARDRSVLVPDKARQKEVWKILGNPGVLLADGEIAGVWRAKASGKKRLDFTVASFDAVRPAVRKAAEEESARVAAAREFPDHRVSWN
ncbi:crosslink repair DNA glycosylase YcaQ family protein [Amycolatopsis sp. NPDC051071]|uniref:DNA glycosylase AlkZ-like family protein n=1 Tax=Amycolatopsis sp. NPDC051071 TaxID=3154637 RepID=UPI0034445CF0